MAPPPRVRQRRLTLPSFRHSHRKFENSAPPHPHPHPTHSTQTTHTTHQMHSTRTTHQTHSTHTTHQRTHRFKEQKLDRAAASGLRSWVSIQTSLEAIKANPELPQVMKWAGVWMYGGGGH